MSTIREELEQKLRALPECPFFAQLLDPQGHLDPPQIARAPYVRSSRLFVVAEVALDRCYEQPGIWIRAVETLRGHLPPLGVAINPTRTIWLNLDWCKLYDRPDASLHLKVN